MAVWRILILANGCSPPWMSAKPNSKFAVNKTSTQNQTIFKQAIQRVLSLKLSRIERKLDFFLALRIDSSLGSIYMVFFQSFKTLCLCFYKILIFIFICYFPIFLLFFTEIFPWKKRT